MHRNKHRYAGAKLRLWRTVAVVASDTFLFFHHTPYYAAADSLFFWWAGGVHVAVSSPSCFQETPDYLKTASKCHVRARGKPSAVQTICRYVLKHIEHVPRLNLEETGTFAVRNLSLH